MEYKVIEDSDQQPVFKPFTIEIRVENVGQLRSMWHRMNLSDHSAAKSWTDTVGEGVMSTDGLWGELTKKISELNLKGGGR